MDLGVLSILSIAWSVLAIVYYVVAILVRLAEWRRLNEREAELALDRSLPESSDRVLIDLSPENITKPGTTEHDLATLEAQLPSLFRQSDPFDLNGLIKNPRNASMQARTMFWFGLGGIVVQVGLATASQSAAPWDIGALVVGGFSLIAIVAMGAVAWYGRKALRIVDAYLDYVAKNRIWISVELTQDKAAYEARSRIPVAT